MTEERSHTQKDATRQTSATSIGNTQRETRRKLLKGAAAALPVVMTLHSGAALARTSNITGEADSIENAVFQDTSNGPQLLCALPDPAEQQPPGGPHDLGQIPQGVLIDTPRINLNGSADKILRRRMEQLENCHARGGIMISAAAYTSIMSKTGININPTW